MKHLELEREALGQLILSPALLESSEDLRPDLFEQGENRRAFMGVAALWEDLRPESIDPGVLAHKASLPATFVASLIDGNFRPDPKAFAWRIETIRKRRAAAELLRLAQDEVHRFLSSDEIDQECLGRIRGLWDVIAGDGEGPAIPAGSLKTGAELQALELKVEWVVDRLLPARSLTLLHSRGGLGKSWLALAAAKAISTGEPFLGLETRGRPVLYVDFENPIFLLAERVRRLDIRDVKFWVLGAERRPPKLDGPDWALYKTIAPPGSLIIFDTLRASHDGDENSSQDAALVMSRLKEIRELGHDIIALHHTGKLSDRVYKGSTAWIDLADHVLDFHQVRRDSLEEIDDDARDPDALFSLGSGEKTRFAPFRTYLTFDAAAGLFVPAEDPKTDALNQFAAYIAGEGLGKNQSELAAWAKEELGIKKRDATRALLDRGEKAGRWKSVRSLRGARCYEPF